MEEVQKANQVRIDDGLTQYVKAATDLEVEALQLQGRNALERPDGKALPDEYVEKANKAADAIEAGLGNQMQREAFRQRVAQLQGQFHKKLTLHMVAAQKDYVREQRQATLDTAVYRGGVLWGDAAAVQQSADTIRLTVEQQLKDDGLHDDEKIREARMIAALTPLHAAVLNGMVDSNRTVLARDYYKNNSASMSLQARDNAMKVIEVGDFEARTQDRADTLYAKHKGDIGAALAAARATLSGKEEDTVVTRLKNYDAERVALRERGQRDAADQAWQLVSQGKRVPPSVLATMDGRDAIVVRKVLTEGTPVKTEIARLLMQKGLKNRRGQVVGIHQPATGHAGNPDPAATHARLSAIYLRCRPAQRRPDDPGRQGAARRQAESGRLAVDDYGRPAETHGHRVEDLACIRQAGRKRANPIPGLHRPHAGKGQPMGSRQRQEGVARSAAHLAG